jgi:hypothetical protein
MSSKQQSHPKVLMEVITWARTYADEINPLTNGSLLAVALA